MKLFAPLALTTALLAAMPASAAVVFADNFATYGSATVTNAPDATFKGNWTTTDGTVDYLASGSAFGHYCDTGNCIDLDGSSYNAGVFSSRLFGPGVYDVLFQLVGNGIGGSDEITITFGSIVQTATLAYNAVLNQDSFGPAFFGVNVGPGGTSLSFATAGGDNIGPILKTVVIETAAVPLPAAGGLMMAGLGLLGLMRRRKA